MGAPSLKCHSVRNMTEMEHLCAFRKSLGVGFRTMKQCAMRAVGTADEAQILPIEEVARSTFGPVALCQVW